MAEQHEQTIEEVIAGLTPKELKFCQLYAHCLNGAKAAREAGYSEESAREIASQNLTKLHIKRVVKHYLEEAAMPMEEAVKRISDTASTRLNDYLTVNKTLITPTVRKGLQQLIDEIQDEIEFEDDYIGLAEGVTDSERERHEAEQVKRKNKIVRYALELQRNPKAFRDVPGEPEWVEQAGVDLVALAKADAKGAIKSISYTEYGPKVELYSAETALKTILEVHGKLIQKHEVTGKDGKPLYNSMLDKMTPEQLEQLQALQQQIIAG